MELALAVVASAANVSTERTLNVLGVFDTINVRSTPSRVPPTCFVFTIRLEYGDVVPVDVVVDVVDDDGHQLLRWNSGVVGPPLQPGEFSHVHLVLPCPLDLTIERCGRYRAHLLAGDTILGSAVFQVARASAH